MNRNRAIDEYMTRLSAKQINEITLDWNCVLSIKRNTINQCTAILYQGFQEGCLSPCT